MTGEKPNINFEPLYFLRCHSKQRLDSADVQTQIWQCAFEPKIRHPGKSTEIVASCGGNTICFINVVTGKVVKKYYADNRENFQTLAWTTIDNDYNVLAAAGSIRTVYFINPEKGFCFHEEKLHKHIGATVGITSILFHPVKTSILYCSCSSGKILVMDIGNPSPPDFTTSVNIIHEFRIECEVLTLIYHLGKEILMCSSDDGIYCFYANPDTLGDNASEKKILIQFPGRSLMLTESPSLVDSVEILEKGLVASKCALRGAIYIWNVYTWLPKSNEKSIVRVTPLYELKWSDTDNYFMYMGYDKESKILACGDDKGAIWTYDLNHIFHPDKLKSKNESSEPEVIQPTILFEWPNLYDQYSNRKRKLNLDVYDIVINRLVLSYKSNYLVAVTNNNMVCIWKRIKEEKAE